MRSSQVKNEFMCSPDYPDRLDNTLKGKRSVLLLYEMKLIN